MVENEGEIRIVSEYSKVPSELTVFSAVPIEEDTYIGVSSSDIDVPK